MCDWIWIHRWALWKVTSPLVYGAVAGLIAYYYQRFLKRFEMRWDTYKDMVQNSADCFLQFTRVSEPAKFIRDAVQAGRGGTMPPPRIKEDEAKVGVEKERLADLANTGIAIFHRLPPLFSEKVSTPWYEMVECFRVYALDPMRDDFHTLYEKAIANVSEAIRAASIEIGMPYKRSRLLEQLEKQSSTKESSR
jgi:hypothetical protein